MFKLFPKILNDYIGHIYILDTKRVYSEALFLHLNKSHGYGAEFSFLAQTAFGAGSRKFNFELKMAIYRLAFLFCFEVKR